MIIGTCGFCSTGSSAVSDYLKEFDENQVFDKVEFTFPYLPDGLLDLEYHLTKKICRDDSCALAIPRFRNLMKSLENYLCFNLKMSHSEYNEIIDDFLGQIVQMKWVATRRTDRQLYGSGFIRRYFGGVMDKIIIPFFNKKLHKCVELYPMHEVEISINPENYDELAKTFIRKFLIKLGADYSKNIVFDQPFPGDDPVQCFHFFDDPVAIVVDRDPRDNYIFTKEFLYKKGSFMPTNSVEDFVKYYKLLRHNRPYQQQDSRILRIHFEDLVYDYDRATRTVRDFCKLPNNPRPYTIFNPVLSIANTQLILKFPQYKSDVNYIEGQLSEYLFDFDHYPKPNNTGKMFMGRSPLNNK